jgi:hypothetical protein
MVKLPIYYNTESTTTLSELGIDYNIEDCDTREVIFFQINAIGRYIENDIEGTTIYANGDDLYQFHKKWITEIEDNINV